MYLSLFSCARENLHFVYAQLFTVYDRHDQDIQHGAQNDDGETASVLYNQKNTVHRLHYVNIYVNNFLH